MNVIATYGTLRKGASAERLMEGCTHLGKDEVQGKLYNLGAYPGLRSSEKAEDKVTVDLWEVPSNLLPRLDRYEGYDEDDKERSLYLRVDTKAEKCGLPIQVYEYNSEIPDKYAIPSGDWFNVEC